MNLNVFGTKVKATRMLCGGWTGCDELHTFFAPEDVLVLQEAQMLDEMCEDHTTPEVIAKAVENKTVVFYEDKQAVIPTLLGMWFEDAAAN